MSENQASGPANPPGRPRRQAPRFERPGPSAPREGHTGIGRIIKPHGTRGEVRVLAFEPGSPNLRRGRVVFIRGEKHRILQLRPDRGEFIALIEGITDRDMAESHRGDLLEIPDKQVRRNDDESYFVHELIGLEVVTDDGRRVGTLEEVLQPGANDVYVVRGPYGEVLVPAIASVINEIDTRLRRMVITPLVGMWDESK